MTTDHPESESADALQADALYVAAYELLRQEARRLVAGEAPGHTLQPTALVHEAYLRLAGSDGQRWESRSHFMSVAARVMRRILIDYARKRAAQKHGRGWSRVTFDEVLPETAPAASVDLLDLIQLDRALQELERSHARMGRVAEMRLFGGEHRGGDGRQSRRLPAYRGGGLGVRSALAGREPARPGGGGGRLQPRGSVVSDVDLERLRAIVLAGAGVPAPELANWLRAACQGDAQLEVEAARLLAADLKVVAGLESAITGLAPEVVAVPSTPDLPSVGEQLGPYRLDRVLGSGGSGTVFAAWQESPVRRWVAVKVLHRNRPLSADLARFRAEQQILAQLDHPHVAKVHDAGTTEAGIPYFVLELVDGRPITNHVREMRLGTEARLELCLQAIRAAEHAHAKGVIHRDLKPSNILVNRTPGGDVVKVIDFGIARLLDAENPQALTMEGLHLGTPAYMSPEQASGRAADCDVRSDVHALGNLLQEVLCGRGVDDVSELATSDQLRLVARGERVLAVRDESGRRLPGDLRAIIAMATEPTPGMRFRTAAELADDVERFRKRLPVRGAARGRDSLTRCARPHPAIRPRRRSVLALVVLVIDPSAPSWHPNAR